MACVCLLAHDVQMPVPEASLHLQAPRLGHPTARLACETAEAAHLVPLWLRPRRVAVALYNLTQGFVFCSQKLPSARPRPLLTSRMEAAFLYGYKLCWDLRMRAHVRQSHAGECVVSFREMGCKQGRLIRMCVRDACIQLTVTWPVWSWHCEQLSGFTFSGVLD
jgi:hypothetical protein